MRNSNFPKMYEGMVFCPLQFYTNFPRNLTLAIYGTGKAGDQFHNFVNNHRCDLSVKYYIDSLHTGEKNGLQILSPDNKKIQEVDAIIVCTYLHEEVRGILKFLKIENWAIFLPYIKYFSRYMSLHKSKFIAAKSLLHMEKDKIMYDAILNYSQNYQIVINNPKCLHDLIVDNFGDGQYLNHIDSKSIEFAIDCGSYNGDTAVLFGSKFKSLKKMICFDPCFTESQVYGIRPYLYFDKRFDFYNLALSNTKRAATIIDDGYGATGIRIDLNSDSGKQVQCTTIDHFIKNKLPRVDFIKMDIEGSEYKALLGAKKTIQEYRPQLAICSYHALDDFWKVPLLMKRLCNNYLFRMGHYGFSIGETVWYAIPREIYHE